MAVKSFSSKIHRGRRTVKILLVATVVVVVLAGVAFANVRVTVPPDPYAPIYADWYGNDEWVAFIFYRDPACVPDSFNLLDFFDFPAAYDCSLTVRGFVIYKNPGDFAPLQAKVKGLGEVPVWFVSVEDYESATEDGLTISELEGLPSLLKGSASFYKETLHPEGHPKMPMKNIVARGTLEDDRSFRLHVVWIGPWPDAVNVNVKIVFR